MHPQLQAVETELARATAWASSLVAPVSEAQFHRRPDPSRWSMAECLVHLNLTTAAFLPLIDQAIDTGVIIGAGAPARLRLDFTGWLLCWISEPPHRHRIKTTARFLPEHPGSRDAVLGEFLELQADLTARLHHADGMDLSQLMITSPFDQRLTYHLYSCFRVLPAHQRRHLWQAEQVWTRLCARGVDAA